MAVDELTVALVGIFGALSGILLGGLLNYSIIHQQTKSQEKRTIFEKKAGYIDDFYFPLGDRIFNIMYYNGICLTHIGLVESGGDVVETYRNFCESAKEYVDFVFCNLSKGDLLLPKMRWHLFLHLRDLLHPLIKRIRDISLETSALQLLSELLAVIESRSSELHGYLSFYLKTMLDLTIQEDFRKEVSLIRQEWEGMREELEEEYRVYLIKLIKLEKMLSGNEAGEVIKDSPE